jgi:tetratricopeptide (TPR) repeat protein
MFNISWHIDRVVKESYTDNYSEAKKWMSLGNYSNALSEINKAISSNPKDFNAIFVRALINGQLNNYNAALADYLEIIRNENNLTNPTFQMGTVYNNLGYSYLQMGESYYKQAKEYIDKACYMSPNESYIWGSLGEYYFKIGDYKNSIEKFNKSIQLIELKASKAPTMEGNGFSYYYRGLNKLKLNDKVGACNDFNKAKELNYKEAETYINSNCK